MRSRSRAKHLVPVLTCRQGAVEVLQWRGCRVGGTRHSGAGAESVVGSAEPAADGDRSSPPIMPSFLFALLRDDGGAFLGPANSVHPAKMTTYENILVPIPLPPESDTLERAVAAYLARYKGQSRVHTESDLRAYLPGAATTALTRCGASGRTSSSTCAGCRKYRRYKPSTVSRRLSVVAGFYRTCVIDGVLEHSPAEYVRRPNVPAESPTLGLSHLQFEAMLAAARDSDQPQRLRPRLPARPARPAGLRSHRRRHRRPRRRTRPPRPEGPRQRQQGRPRARCHPPSPARSTAPSATGQPARSCSTGAGTRMDRHAATRRLRRLAEPPASSSPGCTRTCCATPS